MWATFKELYKYRELLGVLIKRDLQVRYKGSALGFLWSILIPVLSVGVLYYISTFVMDSKVKSLTAYLAATYLPYSFFNQSIMDSAQSVLSNIGVMRKVYMPRELYTVAIVFSNFIHLLLGLSVLHVYLFGVWAFTGFHQPPFSPNLWLVPILLLILLALTLGLSMLFAALNVFYEDVKYILSIVLWMFFFTNPVFYFEETIFYKFQSMGASGERLFKFWIANPLASLLSTFRISLIAPGQVNVYKGGKEVMVNMFGISWSHLAWDAVVSMALLWIGITVFNRMKWKFVERV